MRIAGSYQYPTMERVIYGKPAAEALREEAERVGAKRVYLIASRTLNTTTDEIEKIRKALGDRHADTFDGIPQHTTREVVVKVAKQAQEAKADLVVAIGGGSVVDAAKIVLMCMEHEIFEQDGLDGYETTPERRFGQFRTPKIRMIAIPSTLSGGEYNSGSLVTDTRRKLKQIFNHPMMMPRSIILDPAMTKYTPEKLWLGSGTRAMDHGIEAICSSRPNVLVDAVPAGAALSARWLAAHQEQSRRRRGAAELPVGLLAVGLRVASEGADGREPCHRPRTRRHLRRPALFLYGRDDAERAALQSSSHGNCPEIGRCGVWRSRQRRQRGLCRLHRGAWPAAATCRGWRRRGPLRIDRQERDALDLYTREPAADSRTRRRRQDPQAGRLKTAINLR